MKQVFESFSTYMNEAKKLKFNEFKESNVDWDNSDDVLKLCMSYFLKVYNSSNVAYFDDAFVEGEDGDFYWQAVKGTVRYGCGITWGESGGNIDFASIDDVDNEYEDDGMSEWLDEDETDLIASESYTDGDGKAKAQTIYKKWQKVITTFFKSIK